MAEMMYLMGDREYTRDELQTAVEAEAGALDPGQWMFGEFEFNEWLSDSIATGAVQRVDVIEEMDR